MISNGMLLLIFLITIVLFFWGAYKALKTQKSLYMLAMLPFLVMITIMFLL